MSTKRPHHTNKNAAIRRSAKTLCPIGYEGGKQPRTPDQIAYDAAMAIYSKAVDKLARQSEKETTRKPFLTNAQFIAYLNRQQKMIDDLRESIGAARYQLTGSTGI